MESLKKKLFRYCIHPINVVASKPNTITAYLHEILKQPISTINTVNGKLKLYTNNSTLQMRASTFFTKEPETIDWINGFQATDVLYDIGTNVGMYSLYAAMNGNQVVSFEPESQNYAGLNKNIHINSLSGRIKAVNVALSDECKLTELNLSRFVEGWSCHNVDVALDINKKTFTPEYKQTVLSYALDDFISLFRLPPPTHIKIDVDGVEKKVVWGARKTISALTTKSVLIELNEDLKEDHEIIEYLKSEGYTLTLKTRSPIIHEQYSNIHNYIFIRKNLA